MGKGGILEISKINEIAVMADVHEPEVRSYNMSRIKGKNTKPEILLRKLLFKHGFRFRIHVKNLPGKPDIVLPKYKTVIFVHGCFWHGHEGCKYFVMPKTRTEFWSKKIHANIQRDQMAESLLKEKGWRIVKVWECDLKSINIEKTLENLLPFLKNLNKL